MFLGCLYCPAGVGRFALAGGLYCGISLKYKKLDV